MVNVYMPIIVTWTKVWGCAYMAFQSGREKTVYRKDGYYS